MKLRNLCAAFVATVLCVATASFSAFGANVSGDDAKNAVTGWVRLREALGDEIVAEPESVVTYQGQGGKGEFHVVSLKGGGYVITSGDTEITPILCYSKTGTFDADQNSPMWALMTADVAARAAALEGASTGGTGGLQLLAATANGGGGTTASDQQQDGNADRWARLFSAGKSGGMRLQSRLDSNPADLRVASFVQSKWGQTTETGRANGNKYYNFYTPNNYPCGCVATAQAQVMRYFEFPKTSLTAKTFTCTINGTATDLTMQGGTYDWAHMTNVPATATYSDANMLAIAKLSSDVGISLCTRYTSSGSSGPTFCVGDCLTSTFGYSNAISDWESGGIKGDTFKKNVIPSLDAKLPVVMGIKGYATGNVTRDSGHAILTDGYGYYNNKLYVHLNFGWDGLGNAWYTPAEMNAPGYVYTNIQTTVFNILTSAEPYSVIASGRVLDQYGNAIPGATVTATYNNSTCATATSDARGVYALILPPTSANSTYRTYTVNATYSGYASTGALSVTASRTVGDEVEKEGNNYTGGGRFNRASNSNSYDNNITMVPVSPVMLDQQGGSGGTSYVEAPYGGAMPSIAVPTRSGYAFGGYYTGTDGSGTQYYTASGASARTWDKESATTLYAKWIVPNKVQLWEGGPYWAEINIGAGEPWECGYYFWWGDTVGYKWENDAWVASDGSSSNFSFIEANTPTCNKSIATLQSEGWIVSQNGTDVLAPEHDAAHVKWGGDWRIPTKQDLDDLNNKCDWTWTTKNGMNGYEVRGRGDYASNSIFLPCAGTCWGEWRGDVGSWGGYQSSVLYADGGYSYQHRFGLDDVGLDNRGTWYWPRWSGVTVRPVQGFSVTLDMQGGSDGTTSVTAMYGSAMPSITVPTRTGYTFGGYYTSSGTQYYSASGEGVRTWDQVSAMTLYAQWQVNRYTATFNANGGSGGATKTQDYGSWLSAPAVTRTGYTFTGWWPSVPSTMPAENTTYTAQWRVNQYTVTFDANGGSGGTTKTQDYGTSLSAPSVTRTGYTCTGWSPSVPWTMPAANTTYTAQWQINQYAVTFNANGGTGGKTVMQNYGTAIVAPTVTREGYTFAGWTPAVAATVPAGDVTYTAQWRVNQYTVTFDANGGTGGETVTQNYGTTLYAPSVTRTGYTFTGWSPSVPSKVPAGNMTYYAQWRVNQYRVTFNANGGTGGWSRYLDYGTEIVAPEVSHEGYTFMGWSPVVAATVPAYSVTYYALWASIDGVTAKQRYPWNGKVDISYTVVGAMPASATVKVSATDRMTGSNYVASASALSGGMGAEATTHWIVWDMSADGLTFKSDDVVFKVSCETNAVAEPAAEICVAEAVPVAVDLRTGVRESEGTETLVYSSFWDGDANSTVTISQDGEELAGWLFGEGEWTWNVLHNGTYVLTHTTYKNGVADKVETATFLVTSVVCTVTFDANGGSLEAADAVRSMMEGSPIGTLPVATRTGYTFAGWWTSAYGGTQVSASTMVMGDVTYYAQWTKDPVTYTVTFDANGGTCGETTRIVNEGESVGELPTPAYKGYAFCGWWTEVDGGVLVASSTEVGDGVTYYAHWVRRADPSLSTYCIIDLSAGASAASYPVTYLDVPPDGGFNKAEYKTTKLVLRLIEPGSFKMCGKYDVTLTSPFYCGIFEVTQRQYELVTGSKPFSSYRGDMRPVDCVSWSAFRGDPSIYNWPDYADVDPSTFVGKLQSRTGLNLDLPTEAQWEYACRAGTTSDYNNGGDTTNDLKLVGRYKGNVSDGKGAYSVKHTTVGSYQPNGWGLYDMHGNVGEFCLDWYGGLASGGKDPVGPSSGTNRVIRGGSYYNNAKVCASSYRSGTNPLKKYINEGFRLVRNVVSGGGTTPVKVKVRIGDRDVNLTPGGTYGSAVAAPAARAGWTFKGWYTQPDGKGTLVTSSSIVPEDPVTLYAYWVEDPPVLYKSVYDTVPDDAASRYEGYLYQGSTIAGTIQVKVGKPNKTGLATMKATVTGLDGKKKNLKVADGGKVLIEVGGPKTVVFTGGDACEVTLGASGMSGTYGSYAIDGARSVFASKDEVDKDVASAVLGRWQGAMNVAWQGAQGWNGLSVTIAAKGKVKVAGTLADGTKVSAKGQLLVGEDWCCVPVVYVKKGARLAFNVWLPWNTEAACSPRVVGLADAILGKPGTLKGGATFKLGETMGDAKYAAYLPNDMAVGGGAKWMLPKAGKVQLAKDGTVDKAKLGENPSALKLTYKAKDGTFKGSFKVYADVNGKPKATTVKVRGVLVNGTGYGAAVIKNVGGVGVLVK